MPNGYTVKSGDTLSQIGSKYGYNYNDIAKWNNISNPNKISVGQYLQFSPIKGAPTAQTTKTTTPKPVNTQTSNPSVGNFTNLSQVTKNAQNSYDQATKQYEQSEATKNANSMMNATIDSIAQKYGFDYSRDYAAQQAEALAQAERNAYKNSQRLNKNMNTMNMQRIDGDVRSANNDIDNSFFQNYLVQQQEQVNGGLNSGIAADQNMRLGMAQQQALGDVYRDANMNKQEESMRFGTENLRLGEALDLVEQQRLAKEEELFQTLRQQGFENLLRERDQGLQISKAEWDKMQDTIANNLNISKMEADRLMREADLSGMYDGKKTAEQLAREFQQAMAEKEFGLEKDKFAYQKEIDAKRLAAAAAARYSSGGGGYSSSGGGSGGSSSSYASSPVAAYQAAKKSTSSSTASKYYTEQTRKYKQLYDSQPKVYKPGSTYLDRNPVINKMVQDRIFTRPNLSIPGAYF